MKNMLITLFGFALIYFVLFFLVNLKIFLYNKEKENSSFKECDRFEEYAILKDNTKLYICTKLKD